MRLAGKIAMVTGGGAGIGRAIVLAMARGGADVFIPDIQAANAEAVVEEVRGLGRRAAALRTDVTKESEIEAAIAEGIRALGRIDILVNNAGVIPALGHPFTRQVEADWDKVFNVNLKSVFFTCKHIAAHFMERRYGKIVNISSIAGPLSSQSMPSYSVVKMGVITFTKIVAKELAPYHVNVNAICPGLLFRHVEEDRGGDAGDRLPMPISPRRMFEARGGMDSLSANKHPDDIRCAAVFWRRGRPSITGQALMVDSGVVM
jgi:NAD(P)-dependent dehydrogenase (short-subunit alcohol dehydrogenase family)